MAEHKKEMKACLPEFNLDDVLLMSDDDIRQFTDDRGFNILMLASEAGRIDVVRNLIDRGEDVDVEVGGESAASLAYNEGHYEVVLELLKSNAKFPCIFDRDTATDKLREFFDLCNEMHAKVRDSQEENLEEVKAFLRQIFEAFPSLKYFYDPRDNCSLLKRAIISRQFSLYEFLLSLNIFLAPHESMDEINESLSDDEREELSDLNLMSSPDLITEPMMILIRNCKLGPNTPKGRDAEFMYLIRQAFDDLFKIPAIAIVLEIVAASRNFKIVFDFNRDSVSFLDPKAFHYTSSIIYLNGKIYIGARDMLNAFTVHKIVSVIAYELTHYAMYLVYENLAKPYSKSNTEMKIRFEQIINECKRLKMDEDLIRLVYDCYEKNMYAAELIARVPYMLTYYQNDQEKLSERQKTFECLFDYYEQVCVPQMEKELPNIKAKFFPKTKAKQEVVEDFIKYIVEEGKKITNNLEKLYANVSEVNEKVGGELSGIKRRSKKDKKEVLNAIDLVKENNMQVLKKSDESKREIKELKMDILDFVRNYAKGLKIFGFVIVLLLSLMTLNRTDIEVFQHAKVRAANWSPWHYSWAKLNDNQKNLVRATNVDFYGREMNFGDLYPNDSKVYDLLSSNQLGDAISGNSKALREGFNLLLHNYVPLNWPNMTQRVKEKVLKANVNFQGQTLPLKEFSLMDSVLNHLGPAEIREILNNSFNISSMSDEKVQIYIERYFVDENYGNYGTNQKAKYTKLFEDGRVNVGLSNVVDFDKVVEKIKYLKIFFLSSAAGDGKSTTLRHFNLKLKEKFPLRWIQFVDLKEHKESFDERNGVDSVSNFVGEKLLGLKKFELAVFKQLFESGNSMFLWDDVDQIAPQYKDIIFNFFEEISRTNNFQFVSTRSQISKDIQKRFGVKAYTLIPFSEMDRFELLVRLIAQKFNDDGDEVFEKLKKHSKDDFKSFDHINNADIEKYLDPIKRAQELFRLTQKSTDSSENFNDPFILNTIISDVSIEARIKREASIHETSSKLYRDLRVKHSSMKEKGNKIITGFLIAVIVFLTIYLFCPIKRNEGDKKRTKFLSQVPKIKFDWRNVSTEKIKYMISQQYDFPLQLVVTKIEKLKKKFLQKMSTELSLEQTLAKRIAKCHIESSREISNKVHKIYNDAFLKHFAEVIASSDQLSFNFISNSDSFHYTNNSALCEDFTYVEINCQKDKTAYFVYEIVKNALKIIFKDQINLLRHDKKAIESYKILKGLKVSDKVKPLMHSSENKKFEFFELLAGQFFNLYSDDSLRFENKLLPKGSFEFLFRYFSNPNYIQMIELNRKFCLLRNIKYSDIVLKAPGNSKFQKSNVLIIETNIPQAVLHDVYITYFRNEIVIDSVNLFVDLSLIYLENIQKEFLQVKNNVKKFIINATDCDEESLEFLKNTNPNAGFVLVGYKKDCDLIIETEIFDKDQITRETEIILWNELSVKTQDFLLKKKIRFQNRMVNFGEVFTSNFEKIPPSILKTLCSDDRLEINSLECLVEAPIKFLVREKALFNSEPSTSQNKKEFFTTIASLDGVLEKTKNEKIVFITGEPNSGITHTLKSIEQKLAKGSKFVKYIYSKNQSCKDFRDYVLNHISDENEKFVFTQYFHKGDTIILIDDVKDANFCRSILQDFLAHKRSNQVWISTTDEISAQIGNIFNALNVTFMKIATTSENEKKSFFESHQVTYSASEIFESCETISNNLIKTDEKEIYQRHALKYYFMNEKTVCGLELENIPIPENSKIIIKDKYGNAKFVNFIWVEYYFASIITDSLIYFGKNSQEFMKLFLRILREDVFKNIRTMINSFGNLLDSNVNDLKDAFEQELKPDQILLHSESFSEVNNLSEFVLILLKEADIEYSLYKKLVIDIFKNVVFSIQNQRTKIEFANIKALIEVSKEKSFVLQYLTEKSGDENLVKSMINEYGNEHMTHSLVLACDTAIKGRNEKLLNLLLDQNLISFNEWETVTEQSFDSECYATYQTAKNYGEKTFKESKKLISSLEAILDKIKDLHGHIKDGNISFVKKFFAENLRPALKYYQGREDYDALEVADNYKKYDIYYILLENGLKSNNKSYLNDPQEYSLSKNIQNCKTFDDSHINLLLSKSMNFDSSKLSKSDQKNVSHAFEELLRYPFIDNVLKTVASAEEVKIIFTRDENVKNFDSSWEEDTNALYYLDRKNVLIPVNKKKTGILQDIAHEFTHCALDVVYENSCRPYPKNDKKRMVEWHSITNKYRKDEKFHKEPIIENVFKCYIDEDIQELELAVRVNHLIAHFCSINYKNDFCSSDNDSGYDENSINFDQELENLKQKYHDIFEYYEKYIKNDFEIVDGVPLRKLNDSFGLMSLMPHSICLNVNDNLENIFKGKNNASIKTKNVELLLKSIYDTLLQLSSDNYLLVKSENIFVDLCKLSNDKSLEKKFFDLCRSTTAKRIIVHCHDAVIPMSLICDLTALNQQIVFINPGCELPEVKFSSAFGSISLKLNDESKDKILNTEIEFHLQKIALKEIMEKHEINDEILNSMCKLNSLEANRLKLFDTYDERKLLTTVNHEDSESCIKTTERKGVSLNELLRFHEKFILIHDDIGNGKTDTLKNVFNELIRSNSFWICFVSLKQYELLFEKEHNEIPDELLNFTSQFDRKIFELFWKKQKVILLLDEIDDLHHKTRSNVLKLIKLPNFHKVFLTCRTNLRNVLIKQLNNVRSVSPSPFDEKEKLSLIKEYKFHKKLLQIFNNYCSIPFLYALKNLADEFFKDIPLFKGYEIYFVKIFKSLEINFKISRHDFNLVHNESLKNKREEFKTIFSMLDEYDPSEAEKFPLIDSQTNSFMHEMDSSYWMVKIMREKFFKVPGYSHFEELFIKILIDMLQNQNKHKSSLQMLEEVLKPNEVSYELKLNVRRSNNKLLNSKKQYKKFNNILDFLTSEYE